MCLVLQRNSKPKIGRLSIHHPSDGPLQSCASYRQPASSDLMLIREREKKIASSWLIRKAWSDFTFSQPVARMHGGGGKGELPAWQGPVEKLRESRMPEASRPN